MNGQIKKTIEKIIRIDYDSFHSDRSDLTLLSESGYFNLHDQIGESQIMEAFKSEPDLISEWLQLSEDSRSSERWGISRGDNGKYLVGHWPDGANYENIVTDDAFYACAAYVKLYIESIRAHAKR